MPHDTTICPTALGSQRVRISVEPLAAGDGIGLWIRASTIGELCIKLTVGESARLIEQIDAAAEDLVRAHADRALDDWERQISEQAQ